MRQYFEVVHELFPALNKEYCTSLLTWFWSIDGLKRVHAQKLCQYYPALSIIHCIVATAAKYTGFTSYEGCSFNLALWELFHSNQSPGLEQFIGTALLVTHS